MWGHMWGGTSSLLMGKHELEIPINWVTSCHILISCASAMDKSWLPQILKNLGLEIFLVHLPENSRGFVSSLFPEFKIIKYIQSASNQIGCNPRNPWQPVGGPNKLDWYAGCGTFPLILVFISSNEMPKLGARMIRAPMSAEIPGPTFIKNGLEPPGFSFQTKHAPICSIFTRENWSWSVTCCFCMFR